MKLRGEFVVRNVLDNTVAVPVGQTALQFNGMIMLNAVSRVIWLSLEQETTVESIVEAVIAAFDVESSQAMADVLEFLQQLRDAQLLEE